MSQAPSSEPDTKHKQKDANHDDHGEREVTDPVTHLPVTIHDFTSQELKNALENTPLTGSQQLRATEVGERPKSRIQLDKATQEEESQAGMERLFAPSHEYVKIELIRTFRFAINIGMAVNLLIFAVALLFVHLLDPSKELTSSNEVSRRPQADAVLATITLEALVFACGLWGFRRWVENKVDCFWMDRIWEIERQSEREKADAHAPESTQWLNSLLASVWPLVNPDLFKSLADTLEDSMQASLPKFVSMISVEDLGQGSETPHILGIRWLPPDASACSVSARRKAHREGVDRGNSKYEDLNGQQEGKKHGQYTKNVPREEEEEEEEEEENPIKALEAEEGDSVSLEVAFAYRASPVAGKLSSKAKNAHLFLAIYLPAGIHLRESLSSSSLYFWHLATH
jgi:hypothetical protein